MPVRFESNLNFHDRVSNNTQKPDLIKFHPVGAKLLPADRQTKLMVSFQNSVKVPKKNTYVEVLAICLCLVLVTKPFVELS